MNASGVLDLARPDIRAMAPYASARMESDEARLMLNANEAWPDGTGLHRYPDPQPHALRARLAELYDVEAAQLLVTRGSDEGMDLLVRAFCRAGRDAVMILPPTFGMYATAASVQGAGVVEAPLDENFGVDAGAVLGALTPWVKLVFLCSPNNPVGGPVSLQTVVQLARALAGRAVLVVDEAYIEFAAGGSAATLLHAHANLVVLRTVSKAWGLAAARIGALLAHPDIVALLRRIIAPYPLATPAVKAALDGLANERLMRERVALVRHERDRMRAALAALPAVREVLPSAANFLAVRFHDAALAWQLLCATGIIVRDLRNRPRLRDALRITIGRPADNDEVLAVLTKAITREVGT